MIHNAFIKTNYNLSARNIMKEQYESGTLEVYIKAYESGSNDLRSLNKWLKIEGIKLKAKKGKIIEVINLR
jgi:hypothetical protein